MTDARVGLTNGEAISLSELPLPDVQVDAEVWDVASAARQWRSARQASLSRDEAAQREQELAERLEEAYRRGLVDGRAAAEAEGLELVRTLSAQIETAVAQSDAAVDMLLRQAASEMVEGSLAIARWALAREIDLDPTALLDIAANALAQAGGVGGSQVYVNPALGRAASRWSTRFGIDGPQVVEDPAVEPGSVVVKSAHEGKSVISLAQIIERACELLDLPSAAEGNS